jgi:hypothetical protein
LIAFAFLLTKVGEANLLLDNLIEANVTDQGLTDRGEIAIALAQEIYERTNRGLPSEDLDLFCRLESESFFGVSAGGSLKYGFYGVYGNPQFGPCGTMSRTLLNALWKLDIPARKLQLFDNEEGKGGGHTMVEFYHDGAWRVISPADNGFVWLTEKGEIATARQIQSDPITFSQIYAQQPDYPYLFDNYQRIRWSKLPDGFTAAVRFVIGEHRYNSMETPRLYDLPRTLLLIAVGILAVLLGLMAYITRPGSGGRRRQLPPVSSDRPARLRRQLEHERLGGSLVYGPGSPNLRA